MTSRKGDSKRKGQKYQNVTAFKNDLHDKSRTIKLINETAVVGVCARCKEAIEWRKKFKKYKPLKAPKKCVKCEQKTIKHAYHTYCSKCAQEGGFCEKCGEVKEIVSQSQPSAQEQAARDSALQQELKQLTERQRRTFFRHVEKGDSENTASAHNMTDEVGPEEDEEEEEDNGHEMCKNYTELQKESLNS